MPTTATRPEPISSSAEASLERLSQAIEHAAHLLPAQGPITVFIHHNTLHAFEDLPFDEGVKKGARVFGCQPYLSEDRYRQELARERIRPDDLVVSLERDLGEHAHEMIAALVKRIDLRLAMLQHPLRLAPAAELRWFVAEAGALRRFREDVAPAVREKLIDQTRHWIMRDVRPAQGGRRSRRAHEALAGLIDQFGEASIEQWSESTWEAFSLRALWRLCRDGAHAARVFSPPPPPPVRHRDLLLEAAGRDADQPVHEILIRFCAAFLDQGLARWPLPYRGEGLYRAFLKLYRQPGGPPEAWMRGLAQELARLDEGGVGPLESIRESLELLGVAAHEQEAFLSATLLALRGWAGMIRQMETRGDRVAHPVPPGSLVEFLAIRLVLDRLSVAHAARDALGLSDPLDQLRPLLRARLVRHDPVGVDQRAFLVFQLAQALGWTPETLSRLTKPQWSSLLAEIEAFSGVERRRIFHHAFERRYYTQALDAIAVQSKVHAPPAAPPRFQALFCLDEREESLRRHLEELAPDAETFGVAGFFSVAMYYRGAADAHFVPLCPVVIRPQHWVEEEVTYSLEETHRRRAKTRRALGSATHQLHVGSRTLAGGAFLAAGVGVLASIPLVARILFPRLTAQIRKTAQSLVDPPPLTQLQLERAEAAAGCDQGRLGFTVDEMADIAQRLLQDIGLTSNFARLVLVVGHGSQSLNNPHNSAYNCGACGGSAGGPNARALAQMINDPRVRARLADRGLAVPADTVFVGGYHNTCNDAVVFYDLDKLPKSHRGDFEEAREVIDRACDRNAHERCRRFVSAPLTLSFEAARRHVEGRSEDLAQTRPECGHATNALCIVGRRQRTYGLYMDRRAFLTSYDPTQDDEEATILSRILGAVVPVCAGINLEYYFSYVDPTGYGCGTKLPHNVASLLGVMDGAASDLRTGLPWQMVEIHEPVRLLFVVETTPEAMIRIMDRHEGIGKVCRNGWVQLATLDPRSSRIHVLRNGQFEEYHPESRHLPATPSSVDWYRGWRDHLGFAAIRPEVGRG